MKYVAIAFFILFATISCAPKEVRNARLEEEEYLKISNAATFDLQCPKDQLQLQTIEQSCGALCMPTNVGVTGCEKQARYVRTPTGKWVANTISE